jgi:iron(III) transport system substrate-binding protein
LTSVTIRRHGVRCAAILALALLSACGDGSSGGSGAKSITLYTCVDDTTIGPVIDAFKKANPGTDVELFRAPTGDLNARIAGDVRSGGLKADVVWACDPLTMADYTAQDLVGGWTPKTSIPADYRTDDYVGVAMLYLVAVTHDGVPVPKAWSDLTGPEYAAGVAIPDPSVAASALGGLGYFASSPDYGIDFYSTLKDNGATQVSTPDDVVTGVAEGTYDAGITIASSAYAAQTAGSPIEVSWPSPGAIGIYGPIALSKNASNATTAKDFISYVASKEGQTVLADSGSYPTLEGVSGPTKPAHARVVFPDWTALSTSKDDLLAAYQNLFGG